MFMKKETTKKLNSSTLSRPPLADMSLSCNSFSDNQQQQRVRQELQKFENLRSQLILQQYLNCTIKRSLAEKKLNMENLLAQNEELQLRILLERTIKALEDVLAVEHNKCKNIFSQLDKVVQLITNIEQFLGSQVKKVYVGEGIVINFDQINRYIDNSAELMLKVTDKHREFFAQQPEIAKLVLENIQQLGSQMKKIQEIQCDVQSGEKGFIDQQIEKIVLIQARRKQELQQKLQHRIRK